MSPDAEVELALNLLRGNTNLIQDAKIGSKVNNSLAGALLCRPIGPIGARQYAEAAVRQALTVLVRERKRGK
ncbi:MAG: hypothetical protein AAB654_00875 [Acidobacteriota bacterium]